MADPAALPPSSLELERQVLGACLLDSRAAERAVAIASPADFYAGPHRVIFEAIAGLQLAAGKVDQHLVAEHLRRQGKAAEAGGQAGEEGLALALGLLVSEVSAPDHVADWCLLLREQTRRRRCIAAASELGRRAGEADLGTDELLGLVRGRLDELERGGGAIELGRMSDAYEDLCSLAQGPPPGLLRPGGFGALLELMPGQGLWRGLYVLGGPAGVGKTTITMQMAEACLDADSQVEIVYVSGEMSSADLFLSCVCRHAELDYTEVLAGRLSPDQHDRFARSVADRGNVLRRVRFSRDMRVDSIERWVRRYHPGLLIVDYLQQLKPAGERDFVQAKDRIDAVARGLMELRDRCPGLPLWILASHSRGEAKKPYAPGRGLGAYKETGDIEYSADRCLNLEYTEDEYGRWREGTLGRSLELNLVVLKNRMGRLGKVAVTFVPALQRFMLSAGRVYGSTHQASDAEQQED